MTSARIRLASPLLGLALVAAGCSTMAGGEETAEPAPSAEGATGSGQVVLLTHESFALPKKLVRQFERQSGYDLVPRATGDAGELSAKLSLTADNPVGDVAFGVDNTFASRPLAEGVFEAHEAELPPGAEQYALPDGADRLAPVDVAHVCVNVDTRWFEEEGLRPPRTLADLTKPAYRGLFVTSAASTSSPGMAFLLSTIAEHGDRWQDYWKDLVANDVRIVSGWEDAYFTDFTAGGDGDRPIVLSYDSSPAFTIDKRTGESTTAALLDTCFRQVEYAGVLEGADNPEGARAVVDFLLSDDVQAALPTSMYVFPVSDEVELPADWAKHAQQPTDPYTVDPAEIAAQREQWLTEWTDVTTR
ncbi:MAG TPA: thiamine ABC transporter substrate-binding protein [Nocardioides sp.]